MTTNDANNQEPTWHEVGDHDTWWPCCCTNERHASRFTLDVDETIAKLNSLTHWRGLAAYARHRAGCSVNVVVSGQEISNLLCDCGFAELSFVT